MIMIEPDTGGGRPSQRIPRVVECPTWRHARPLTAESAGRGPGVKGDTHRQRSGRKRSRGDAGCAGAIGPPHEHAAGTMIAPGHELRCWPWRSTDLATIAEVGFDHELLAYADRRIGARAGCRSVRWLVA